MAQPLINGQAFDFTQIALSVAGVPIASITEVNYEETQEKSNNFGAGTRPVSRGRGPIEATGSITISMNDVRKLKAASPNGSLNKLPAFDVVVTYLNEQNIVTDVLKNCEFTNDGVEASQGDMDLVKSFDLIMSDIEWGT